jgi:PAS domain S-box-containing protein
VNLSQVWAAVGRLFYRRGYDYRRVVREFGQDLSQLQELPVLMRLILDRVVNTWQLKTAALVLREEEGEPYLVREIDGLPDKMLEISFSPEGEVVRSLSQRVQPLEWPHERTWVAHLPAAERSDLEAMQVLLIVPLQVKDRLIGWLNLGEKRSEHPYAPDDVELLGTLAGQAGVALENAILYERRRREVAALEVLNRIGLAANTLELDDLLEQIYLEVSRLLDAPHFYIALYNEEAKEFSFAFHVDNGVRQQVDASMNWPLGQGLTSEIVRTGEPIVTRDYLAECQRRGVRPPGQDDQRRDLAWLGVPLLAGSRVLGILCISSSHDGTVYRTEHVRLLSTLAAQAAVAIESARLREREQQRVAELETLQEVARAIGSSIHLDELLQSIYRAVQRTLDARNFYVALYDPARAEFSYALEIEDGQVSDLQGERWSLGVGLTSEVVRLRQPIRTDDYTAECARRGILPSGRPDKAWLGVPMIVGEEIIGVLVVSSFSAGTTYTENDLRLLSTIAAQAASAVQNARLYERTDAALTRRVDELTALEEIARELNTSLDFQRVIEIVLDRAMAATAAQVGGVVMRTADDEGLQMVAYRGPQAPAQTSKVWSVRHGVIGRVVRTGRPALVIDVRQDPDYVDIAATTRSELAVPIVYGGQTIGAINLESDQEAAFDEEDLRFLQRLADHTAVASSNARLFQERGRRITELAILNEIGRAVSSALDLTELLETIYQQVGRLFNTTDFYIAAYDEETGEWETLLDIANGERRPAVRYKVAAGLTGHIIRHKAPLLFRSRTELLSFETQAEIHPVGAEPCSWLGVPLIHADNVVGVMGIESYEQEGLYSEQDLALFSTIAGQAAIAIANARLFRGVTAGRDRLQAILDSTRDGILMLDEAGDILLANPPIAQWTGLPQERIVGGTLLQLFRQATRGHPEMRRSIVDELARGRQILAGNPQATLRGTSEVTVGPPQFFEWFSLPVLDRSGQQMGRILVVRDVTEAREAERMREDLGSMIVHDLRGPLTAILGSLETILERDIGPLTETQRSLLDLSYDGARHMQGLVNTLLDIRQLEAGKLPLHFAPMQLAEAAHGAVARLAPLIQERRLTVVTEVATDLPAVRADAESIARVFENLLHNAIKYSYPGGAIRVQARAEGSIVLCSVTDYGLGIPKAEQERIFEKFSQLRRPGMPRGTGLGLAFCRLIIVAHQGRIWVESEEGKGSTFCFTLPIWEG